MALMLEVVAVVMVMWVAAVEAVETGGGGGNGCGVGEEREGCESVSPDPKNHWSC